MRDIWGFLLQTLTGASAAALLLIVKKLLQDKLSPRWQFSVWALLGICLLIPAGRMGRYALIDWPLLIETLKTALTGDLSLTRVTAPVPLLPKKLPQTPADWLFLIYFAGVVFFLLRYLVSYGRLRIILRRGAPADAETAERIANVEKQYGLKCCKAVMVPGLTSAFVCGVIHPVLALPGDRKTDEKVLLHEMLHLKNRDALWGVITCLFRCVHWCNPFLWYCADRVGNDMEAFCDQRVLERLEGEERREYGRILLSMANEKYARTPGTTSAANGGKNIRFRIEAISRFKRYPAGMALVSVCIALVLAAPFLHGSTIRNLRVPGQRGGYYLETAMATARLTQCTTPEGALDTYAKSLIADNGIYRMMCAPQAQQQELAAQLHQSVSEHGALNWGSELPGTVQPVSDYFVYDLQKISSEEYKMLLVILPLQQPNDRDLMQFYTQSVQILREKDRWVCEPLDKLQMLETESGDLRWGCKLLPSVIYEGKTEDFKLEVHFQKSYHVKSDAREEIFPMGMFSNSMGMDILPQPDAGFDSTSYLSWAKLTYLGDEAGKDAITSLGVSYIPWEQGQVRPQPEPITIPGSAGGSSDGTSWACTILGPEWKNPMNIGGMGSQGGFDGYDQKGPDRYAADLYVNGEKIAELTVVPQEAVK